MDIRSPSRSSQGRLAEFRSRLESTLNSAKPSSSLSGWKKYRSDLKQPVVISSPSSSVSKLNHYSSLSSFRAASPHRLTQQTRVQSPLAKFRDNPELFYKKINSMRPSTPGTGNITLSSAPSNFYRPPSHQRSLQDILHHEDLSRAIDAIEDMTDTELRNAGYSYTRELLRFANLVQSKLGKQYF
jgi:hypothetical protein